MTSPCTGTRGTLQARAVQTRQHSLQWATRALQIFCRHTSGCETHSRSRWLCKAPHALFRIRADFLGRGCDEALFSGKKGFFSEKGGGNSANEGFGKDFYMKGNSAKRSGRFTAPPDSENWKPGSSKWRFAALRFAHSQDIGEIRGPNAFKTRLKCPCHELALSVTTQTRTWNCPGKVAVRWNIPFWVLQSSG